MPAVLVPAAVSRTRDCERSVERAKGVADCSAILADPRCVLNIKSSAVIPLAAPNTKQGLLVAMATVLLSNIPSGGSASLTVSLFFSLFFLSLLLHSSSSPFHLCVSCVKYHSMDLLQCLLFVWLWPHADRQYLWTVPLMHCK